MPNYIAVAQIFLASEDHVSAISEADDIKLAVERDLLDPDLNEEMDIVEVVEGEDKRIPLEIVIHLRHTRNILLGTRSKEGYDLARSLDEFTHMLEMKQVDTEESRSSYDYSKLLIVLKEVLDGKNPLDH